MAEQPPDPRRGRVPPLHDWLTGVVTPPPQGHGPGAAAARPSAEAGGDTGEIAPTRIGHYTLERKLGEGGMGVVYAARDERLQRVVALKTMSSLAHDETARRRFWREARAAASVNHPNICQIYEIGEHEGELFIAMELLEGEVLADRLRRGAMRPSEAVPIGLGVLDALTALHGRGIVHRDLKPSNVFLTRHGVKLLDFGLARPELEGLGPATGMTRTGIVMGTPRYMAPEQVSGDPVDARTDVFAAGAILFEMFAGRPAFSGRTVIEVLHATRHEQPPALSGSPAVAAVDRVIRRALAKRPEDRPISAEAMAEDLRSSRGAEGADTPAFAHALTRLVVLPFRVLRPDAETDFLAFSLPDAIATSLARFGSLILRSSAVAARFAGDAPDLKAIAAAADVDRVVMGSLLRSGDQLRASVQLIEAPSGTLLASHILQSSMGDLFGLQDDITRRVVDALALPLAGSMATPMPDVPRDARAYELYLRGNEAARSYDGLVEARALYEQAIELDARFAPAWARLGRCCRVIGKFIDGDDDSDIRAEEAFRRALALSPRLSIAHKYYANLEADIGQATRGMVRLIEEAARHGNDPELFAGLVRACRYCGLYEQSIAAHVEARRLDPNVPTSYEQTLLLAGEIDRLLETVPPATVVGADAGIRVIALGLAGRRDEARVRLAAMRQPSRIPAFQSWVDYLESWLDGRVDAMLAGMASLSALKIQDDPEAIFQEGWLLCDVGGHALGLPLLQRAIDKGYSVAPTLAADRRFDPLRSDPAFAALADKAAADRARALAAFRDAGGDRLLGT